MILSSFIKDGRLREISFKLWEMSQQDICKLRINQTLTFNRKDQLLNINFHPHQLKNN